MISTIAIRALANEGRLQILEWLKNPTYEDLVQAGLARPKRIEKRTFYKRDRARIKQIKKAILAKV